MKIVFTICKELEGVERWSISKVIAVKTKQWERQRKPPVCSISFEEILDMNRSLGPNSWTGQGPDRPVFAAEMRLACRHVNFMNRSRFMEKLTAK